MTPLKQLLKGDNIDQEVVVGGWIRSLRKNKGFSFIALNDGTITHELQIVVDQKLDNYEKIVKCNTGACLLIKGKLVRSQGKNQTIEVQASSVEIHGDVEGDYPLQKKSTSLEFLRENAHLRMRTKTFGAVFRVRNALSFATHLFFNQRNFINVHTPIITASDAEGAGDLFRVSTFNIRKPETLPLKETGKVDFAQDFFGKETYLACTGQLEAEAFALGMSNVYTFGPTFRSENSNTPRHLAEFWMIEPEMSFCDLEGAAALASDYVKFMIDYCLKNCSDELAFFEEHYQAGLVKKLELVNNSQFEKVSYTDAISILNNSTETFEYPVKWGMDLQTEHERYLAEKHFKGPVIVTDYPKEIKAFYMRLNDDGKTVRAMDVLVPGIGELIGGSQREERLDMLKKRIDECKLKRKDYRWYLDLRRHGGCQHSGFGLGLERMVMYVTGMSNIRDVIPFPRTPKNVEY